MVKDCRQKSCPFAAVVHFGNIKNDILFALSSSFLSLSFASSIVENMTHTDNGNTQLSYKKDTNLIDFLRVPNIIRLH